MNLKKRETLIGLLAFGLILLFIGDRLIFSPLYDRWKSNSEQIEQLVMQIDKAEKTIQLKKSVHAELLRMRKMALPKERSKAESQLLSQLADWSGSSGFQTDTTKPTYLSKRVEGYESFPTIELKTSGKGDMEQIVRFLHTLETAPVAVAIESLKITARDEDLDNLTLSITISGPLETELKVKQRITPLTASSRG